MNGSNPMWQTKLFKNRQAMEKWLAINSDKIQWEEIFINNGYGLTYRKLRTIY